MKLAAVSALFPPTRSEARSSGTAKRWFPRVDRIFPMVHDRSAGAPGWKCTISSRSARASSGALQNVSRHAPAPVRVVLEKALVLAERKISCAFDILFSRFVHWTAYPMLSGSNVASMIRRRFDSIRPSTRNSFASACNCRLTSDAVTIPQTFLSFPRTKTKSRATTFVTRSNIEASSSISSALTRASSTMRSSFFFCKRLLPIDFQLMAPLERPLGSHRRQLGIIMQHHQRDHQRDGFFDRVRGFDRNDTSVGGVEHSDDVFGTLVCGGRKGSFHPIADRLRGCNERDLGVDPHRPEIQLGGEVRSTERIRDPRRNPDTPPHGTEPRRPFAYTAARSLSAFDLFLDFAKTIG